MFFRFTKNNVAFLLGWTILILLLLIAEIYVLPAAEQRGVFITHRTATLIIIWLVGVLGILNLNLRLHRELTLRTDVSRELNRQRLYFENLIANAPEGIVWADVEGRVKYINPEFTNLFGWELSEIKGLNIDEVLTRSQETEAATEITRAVQGGLKHQFEGLRYRKDGSALQVSIIGAPMTTADGDIQVFGIYRDISKEKEALEQLAGSEARFRELATELQEANDLKELLLDIITHDLRNPAGVIRGVIEMALEERPRDEGLQLIQQSSEALSRVIESASTLSRLSIGESIQLEEMDLVPVIHECIESFNSQLDTAGMSVDTDLPESLPVQANPVISEIFANYLSNAVKYANRGGRVSLRGRISGEHVVCECMDWGRPIPDQERERIFQRRTQLESSDKKGSGLGLAIVKRIADAHGAKVGVRPNGSAGNVFYLELPAVSGD